MSQDPNKPYDINDYNNFYREAESCDAELFAEQRSNILLVAGEHYNKRRQNLNRRLKDFKDLSQEQKIRLTKNHIQKICKTYVNNIISMAPGVGFRPKNPSELKDQKDAELHRKLWQDAKVRCNLDDLIDDWCDSFVNSGEVAVKVFFDPSGGAIIGYEQVISEDGQPTEEQGAPIFAGEMLFEEIYGFNLLRPAECKDMRKAEWLCLRKMASKADLLARYGNDDDKKKAIVESADETMLVFDGAKSGYRQAKGEVLIREFYFRPCARYPKGWFVFTTKEGVLEEGELPGGIFPIIFSPFDKVATTPRGRGPVKTMRPYQIEINRAASKIAEHQITLGDDKLIIQNGSKVSPAMALPGVRAISVTGSNPIVMQGRDGSQYLAYMQAQIAELYQVMNVVEDSQENQPTQLDPYALLFRSARQKKKFQRYIKRFEKFLIEIAKIYLKLAKLHYTDEMLVKIMGADEQVNLPELRDGEDQGFEIIVEAQSDDIETKMGQQLIINHALQYVGSQLTPEDIGKFMRASPLGNFEGAFEDMTLAYDRITNDILAMDRGERPPVNQSDDHTYAIKRLTSRMAKSDFKYLSPQIQSNYQARIDVHNKFEAFNQLALQRMKSGYIPTGGYLVVCDLYMTDPKNPEKTQRARLPYEALVWLIKQLQAQGSNTDTLAALPESAQVQIGQQMAAQAGPLEQQPQLGAPDGMGLPAAMGNKPEGLGNANGSASSRSEPAGYGGVV
jgi:hypothetical protein